MSARSWSVSTGLFSRERWGDELRPYRGARRESVACRDMFCTRCPPTSTCASTLFADFPQVASSELAVSRGDEHDPIRQFPLTTHTEMWSQVLELLDPFRSEAAPSPVDTQSAARPSFPPIQPTLPKKGVEVQVYPSPSKPMSPRRLLSRLPLVQTPTRFTSLFWRHYNESPRYYPDLPLVQSPIQVADLERPVTPLSLESPSSLWTDSDTLCPSQSSGAVASSKFQTLKRWKNKKKGRRGGSLKTILLSGKRTSSPPGPRWVKSLRKAAHWMSSRERRKSSSQSRAVRASPQRRDAIWRSASTRDYSVYFPRPLSLERAQEVPAPPSSPSSVYSQETFHSLFDEDPSDDCPADDEMDILLDTVSEMPTPLVPSPSTPPKSRLVGWLDAAFRAMWWENVAYGLGRLAFCSTRLALRITLLAVPPLAAWAAFRVSDAALRTTFPPSS